MSENLVELKGGKEASERAELMQHLAQQLHTLNELPDDAQLERMRLQLDVAESLIALERKLEAWALARSAFDVALRHDAWKDAVEACDVLYQCEQPGSVAALGMGVWLAVSFPVDPELTLAMLMHIVEETPDNSDGAALAAVAARYVIDLRAEEASYESLSFLANALIGRVAERHSKVRDQAALDQWMNKLQLRDPAIFLPRLSKVVNIIVGDTWWFDRDALRNKFN
ncbi:hypothetical protein OYT1_ch2056 [Ferriphaselus amnicola]|uniref:Uncharacterized protein n=1 Tax=Ferriphaselus amnicola TaxID=1188319 RepID=A0A2Z6GD95_9PROT|nr:hypothetical protein [Ferriphaselus amnicola]BBE51581.1 hypothetical protein OYT1_ch2056 [Ferriphaselus amnicola]